ncbi:hypothetical protein [Paraburkholderia fungorum]|jgi:hypothetical protein|uniref:hypothetical protein n=1 Tax=Paraburkholderia fungorum TaxID=134537 RepID=UPI000D07A03D|nr:hypothetical protein [Paraburkholderia fungorum]
MGLPSPVSPINVIKNSVDPLGLVHQSHGSVLENITDPSHALYPMAQGVNDWVTGKKPATSSTSSTAVAQAPSIIGATSSDATQKKAATSNAGALYGAASSDQSSTGLKAQLGD